METKEIKCRCCGLVLRKTTSGADNPDTGEDAKQNYYGGWVCSKRCDSRECIEMASSMPGAGRTNHPSAYAQKQIDNNWG